MSGLDLYEREAAERVGRLQPIERPQTGTWDGFLRGTGMAAMRTFAKTARAIDMVGAVGPIVQDAISGGTAAQDRYFKEHDQVFGSAVDFWTPKPGEVGVAGEVTGQLLATIPLVVMSPALTVGATQLGTAEDLTLKGVDPVKSQLVGGAQGAGLGLGIYMPIFGQSLWQRMLVGGAGFNVVQGAAMRGVSEQILKGTAAEGEFKLLDSDAFTLDLLLGLGFGAISHVSPAQRAEGARMWAKMRDWGIGMKDADRDALAALRQAQHSNVDSLPGKPLGAEDVNAHVDRVRAAVDQLARGERVEVGDLPAPRVEADSKRWTEAERRARLIVKEAESLAKAYDIVLREPLGPINDPIVRLTPEDIGEVIVERGPVWKRGEADIKIGGYGLVKFIWRHGERSIKSPEFQVTRDDVMRTPEVLRDYLPIEDKVGDRGERYTEWQVERADGKKVIYAIRKFTEADDKQHLVTLFVNDGSNKRIAAKPLSQKANRLAESPDVGSKPLGGDTGPGPFSVGHPGGQEGGSGTSITEPAGPLASRAAGTPPSEPGALARPAAQPDAGNAPKRIPERGDGAVDPLALEADRVIAERPDLTVTMGVDEEGRPVRKTAKAIIEEARAQRAAVEEDAKLFEVAAACLMGVA